MSITEEITKMVQTAKEKHNLSPREINNGLCEEFAMAVIERMGGYSDNLEEVSTESFVNIESDEWANYPGHVWIYYGDKFYDAECPQGVNDWRELPIFRRIA